MRAIFFAFIFAVLVATTPVEADESTRDVFQQIGGKWIERYLAEDLDGLMALYTDDAKVMLHGQPAMTGKADIREFFAASLGTARVTFDIDVERAEIHGRMAYLISKYWMSVTPHGSTETITDVGRSLLIYKQEKDGEWRIHADIDQATPDVTWPPNGDVERAQKQPSS
ncbi:MAG: SgcJ/EcaC family oxidoreductase [Gammaproteobacteria bacterium]